jgi:hypothetical protein
MFEPVVKPGGSSEGVVFAVQKPLDEPVRIEHALLFPGGTAIAELPGAALPQYSYRQGLVAYLFDPDRQRALDHSAVSLIGGEDVLPGEGLPVSGSFGTKIEALVRALLALQRQPAAATTTTAAESVASRTTSGEEQPVKSLIFSQFDGALVIAEAALRANGIPCLRLRGGRAASGVLSRFARDVACQALLMPFKTGSEGLNLTCATHVFLLEPLLEPAAEQQAIGRVHRMGQVRATFVHRLIIRDTLEETVAALARQRLAGGGNVRKAPASVAEPASTALARLDSESSLLRVLAEAQTRLFGLSGVEDGLDEHPSASGRVHHSTKEQRDEGALSGLKSEGDNEEATSDADAAQQASEVEEDYGDVQPHAQAGTLSVWGGGGPATAVRRSDVLALFEAEAAWQRQLRIIIAA